MVGEMTSTGFSVLRNFFPVDQIDAINEKIEVLFENNNCLGPAVNVAGLSGVELESYGDLREKFKKANPNYMVSQDLINSGDKDYRNLTIGQNIEQPLINVPELFNIVTNKHIIDLVSNYLNSSDVRVGYVKIRRYFANNAPDFDTNIFHIDDNSQALVKAIIYLSDIYEDDDGVFCYVSGSKDNVITEPGYSEINPLIRSNDQVYSFYGEKSVHKIFASRGSVVLADTLGLHKGTKTRTKDRTALYVNYVLEEEYGGKGVRQKIASKHFDDDPKLKSLFEYFEIVGD